MIFMATNILTLFSAWYLVRQILTNDCMIAQKKTSVMFIFGLIRPSNIFNINKRQPQKTERRKNKTNTLDVTTFEWISSLDISNIILACAPIVNKQQKKEYITTSTL